MASPAVPLWHCLVLLPDHRQWGWCSLTDIISAQVDFGYFGPPEEHLEWTEEEREATYITPEDPSSEICGEVAATFAASAMALRETGIASLLHACLTAIARTGEHQEGLYWC